MRQSVRFIVSVMCVLLYSGMCDAQTQPKPAAPAAGQALFESELADPSRFTTGDVRAALQELLSNSNQRLDTIQNSISQQIDTVEKAEAIYEQIDRTINSVADRLAPKSPFNNNMEKLRQLALEDVKKAAADPDAETRKFADKFQVQADEFEKIKSESVAEYQNALNFLDSVHAKKNQIIFQIKLKAYTEAAKLARNYITQAKDTLKAMQPLVPVQPAPQKKDNVSH
jgi:hypothetical protein